MSAPSSRPASDLTAGRPGTKTCTIRTCEDTAEVRVIFDHPDGHFDHAYCPTHALNTAAAQVPTREVTLRPLVIA